MEKDTGSEESLFENLTGYFNARIELIKLQLVEKTTSIFSIVISILIIIPFFMLAFLFLSIALAHFFSELWGHEYAGYLTVTLIYLVTGLLLIRFRQSWLVRPLQNSLIKQIFIKKHHE